MTLVRGMCTATFAFEVGQDIQLAECERRLGASERQTVRSRRRLPRYFEYTPPPLRLTEEPPRAAVLGNAAQSLHPVAGQGFNLALRDVAMLAELLAEGGDPGLPALLARYAAGRAPDREAVVRFTDALVRGFGLPLGPLARARGHGLLFFDLMRPVKREFARRTMGLAGRQPRLVRGLSLVRDTT